MRVMSELDPGATQKALYALATRPSANAIEGMKKIVIVCTKLGFWFSGELSSPMVMQKTHRRGYQGAEMPSLS